MVQTKKFEELSSHNQSMEAYLSGDSSLLKVEQVTKMEAGSKGVQNIWFCDL